MIRQWTPMILPCGVRFYFTSPKTLTGCPNRSRFRSGSQRGDFQWPIRRRKPPAAPVGERNCALRKSVTGGCGGDEFVLVLPDSSLPDAQNAGTRTLYSHFTPDQEEGE